MKKNSITLFIVSALIVIILLIAGLNYNKNNQQNQEITSFEECAEAGYPILESFPRQCNANGINFVEYIDWREDGVVLMRNSETQEYACFGCGLSMCVDPIPTMLPAEENDLVHCNYNFEITVNGLIQKCPDAWIDNQMPISCDLGECEARNREYFIVNEKRREISDFDLPWIEANCDIEKQVVY